jgi:hypothetical protein
VAQPAAVPNDASLLHTARSNAPAQRPTGGLLDHAMRAPFEHAAQRAAECFDMPYAVVSTIDPDLQAWHLPLLRDRHKGSDHRRAAPRGSGTPGWPGAAAGEPLCQAVLDRPGVLVVPDIARDPRLRAGPALLDDGMRFLAAAPLRDARGQTLGALCLLDRQPRLLSAPEQRLLQAMADDLMQLLRSQQELVQTPGGEDDSGSHALAGVARMAARLAARGADLASAVPASLRQVTGGITVTSDRRDQPDQPNHNTHRAHRKNSTDEQGQSAAKGPTDAPEPGTQHDRPVEAEAADSAQGEGIQTASVRHPVDGDAEFHGRDTETARWHPRRLLPGSS